MALEPHGVDSWFERITAKHGGSEIGGEWMTRPWDLVARNGAYLERDFAESGGAEISDRHLTAMAPRG